MLGVFTDAGENISYDQRELLNKFKEKCQDVISPNEDDGDLIRWLIARNWDLKDAEDMYRHDKEWREEMGADTILEDWEPPEAMMKYYPGGVSGFAKNGMPVWMEPTGQIDLKGIVHAVKKTDIEKYTCWKMEKMYKILREESQKCGRRIDKFVVICDLTNLGTHHLWKPGVDMGVHILELTEKHYPETLSKCYIINAPSLFPMGYNLIKPFLSEETRKKLLLCEHEGWEKQLLEDIDPDQLPKYWGGTQSDPDGDTKCSSKICQGGEIPRSYYLNEAAIHNYDDFLTVSIPKREHALLGFDVVEKSVIRWQFSTKDCGYDIGFAIYRKTTKKPQPVEKMEEIVKPQRCDSHLVPEDGAVTVDTTGIYVVQFDNTYSMATGKEVKYLIEILPVNANNNNKKK